MITYAKKRLRVSKSRMDRRFHRCWDRTSFVSSIFRGALLYVPSNHFFATARNTLCNFPFLVSPTRCNNLSSAKKERYTHLSSARSGSNTKRQDLRNILLTRVLFARCTIVGIQRAFLQTKREAVHRAEEKKSA